jgi:hypothetical protein
MTRTASSTDSGLGKVPQAKKCEQRHPHERDAARIVESLP